MTTTELISELRDWAEAEGPGSRAAIMKEAADRIEEQDERLAILETALEEAERAHDEP